jgi:hypothetical protein
VYGTTAICLPNDGFAVSIPTVSQSPLWRRETWPEWRVLMIPSLHSAEINRPCVATHRHLPLRQQSLDGCDRLAPLLRDELNDPAFCFAVPLVLKPFMIIGINAIFVSAAGNGTACMPEVKILSQIIRIDAFADQLRIANDFIETRLQGAKCLAYEVVRFGEFIVLHHAGRDGPELFKLRLDYPRSDAPRPARHTSFSST